MSAMIQKMSVNVVADAVKRLLCRWLLGSKSVTVLTNRLPSGSQWLHETKHDGFRIIARKDGSRVRL
jgi:ATP-dependent DNA ligase